ncbi:MAG: hypothetical protein WC585_07925 [Brevundimonas sp.]
MKSDSPKRSTRNRLQFERHHYERDLRFTFKGKSLVVALRAGRAFGLIDGVLIVANRNAADVLRELIVRARQTSTFGTDVVNNGTCS